MIFGRMMRLIIIVCSSCVLALPLFVDGSVIYPFSFSKVIPLQILIEIAIAAYIILCTVDRSYPINWKHPLVLVNGIFVLLMLVLSFTGIDSQRSLWSTARWMTGAITYIHLFFWFLVLSATIKTWKEWRVFSWISIAVCFGVIVYGFAQLGRFDGVQLSDTSARIYSLLGNPVYLALYILLNLFLSVVLFLKEWHIFLRILTVFFWITGVVALFLSGTRSAVLALLISLVLFGIAYLFTVLKGKTQVIGFAVLGTLVAAVVSMFLWFQTPEGVAWSQKNLDEGTHRIVSQLFQDPARVELAHIAWQGFLARPLFGWGPNNYTYIFSTFVEPKNYGTLLPLTWYDQAHNQVMNVMATLGIVGLLSYLSLWIVAWILLFKKIKITIGKRERLILTSLSLFFFTYFLQTLTAFDTVGPMIMLYFGFALTYFFLMDGNGQNEVADSAKAKGMAVPPPLIMIPTIVIAIIAITFVNLVPYAKARAGKKAIDVTLSDFDRGLQLYSRALSGSSFTHEDVRVLLAQQAALYNERFKVNQEKKKAFLFFAISEEEKNVERHPLSLEYSFPLLELYRFYAENYSSDFLYKAEKLSRRLAGEYPRRRDILYERALIAKLKGDYEISQKIAKEIIDLDPNRGESHWLLASILAKMGDVSGTFTQIEHARSLNYPIFKDTSIYADLAFLPSDDAYKRLDSYLYEAWFSYGLETLDLARISAIIRAKVGTKEFQRYIIKWIKDRDPDYARKVEEEIESLRK